MPRLPGQIDQAKTKAILDAASVVLFELGLKAPIDEIARRAGVSKQTIYNHYGSKAELVKALIHRRVDEMAATLDTPGAEAFPQATLTAYARDLLRGTICESSLAMTRLAIESVPTAPDLARAVFTVGVRASRLRLAAFLQREVNAGRLAIDDTLEAAIFFAGMVIGHHQHRGLLGLPPELDEADIARIAAEASRRFLRAYAPAGRASLGVRPRAIASAPDRS